MAKITSLVLIYRRVPEPLLSGNPTTCTWRLVPFEWHTPYKQWVERRSLVETPESTVPRYFVA